MRFNLDPECQHSLHNILPIITIIAAVVGVAFFVQDARMQTHITPIRQDVAVLEQKVDTNAIVAATALEEVKDDVNDVKSDVNELKVDMQGDLNELKESVRWLIQRELSKMN